jgi:hypothetical protein
VYTAGDVPQYYICTVDPSIIFRIESAARYAPGEGNVSHATPFGIAAALVVAIVICSAPSSRRARRQPKGHLEPLSETGAIIVGGKADQGPRRNVMLTVTP